MIPFGTILHSGNTFFTPCNYFKFPKGDIHFDKDEQIRCFGHCQSQESYCQILCMTYLGGLPCVRFSIYECDALNNLDESMRAPHPSPCFLCTIVPIGTPWLTRWPETSSYVFCPCVNAQWHTSTQSDWSCDSAANALPETERRSEGNTVELSQFPVS